MNEVTTTLAIVKGIDELLNLRRHLTGSVGFVPTMGYLHAGHLSLVELAKEQNDHVIVSIFINPKQFSATEDLDVYPHDVKRDISLLTPLDIDILFTPVANDLYPDGFSTYVEVEKLTKHLEGNSRPEHFRGVTTIVTKLFNLIQPTRAYFGQKDIQQALVIKKMVTDLNIPTEIIVGDTVREADGLAMSSRNVFLSQKEREEATALSKSLTFAQQEFYKGERSADKIKKGMEAIILKTSGEIDYLSIADPTTLEEVENIDGDAIVSLAVRFGKTRLIDNCLLSISAKKKSSP